MFLLYALKQKFYKDDVMGNGTIFSSTNKNELQCVEILVPKSDIVHEFDKIASNYIKEIHTLTLTAQKLSAVKGELLSRLISGLIEINA